MIKVKINKIPVNYGICSKRKVDLMIRDKKIVINGRFALIGVEVDHEFDSIYINVNELEKQNTNKIQTCNENI